MTRLKRFLAAEDGTATIEFCFVVPIVTLIFLASFESSFYMARYVMLDRSVDLVVRDLRLGTLIPKNTAPTAGHNLLKTAICQRTPIIQQAECMKSIRIWMQPVNTTTFAMVAPPDGCVDKSQPIDPLLQIPATEFSAGNNNEIMLMRVCLKEEPMFPTSAFGAGMIKDDGNYALITTSVFVNEPT